MLLTATILIPSCEAASGDFQLATSRGVTVNANVIAVLPGGSATMEADTRSFVAAFEGLAGTFTLYEWNDTVVPGTRQSIDRESTTPIEVVDARVSWTTEHEAPSMRVAVWDGEVRVRGETEDEGRVAALGRPALREQHTPTEGTPLERGRPRFVPIEWRADWYAVGTVAADRQPMDPFPQVTGARLDVQGRATFLLHGGNVTITDASGNPRSLRLGTWEERSGPLAPALGSAKNAYLEFNGTLARSDVPLGERWGVAGPTIQYLLDGEARFEDAAGTATVDGRERSFTRASVRAAYDGSMLAAPALVGSDKYSGSGNMRSFIVDGEALVAPAPGKIAPTAATLSLALLVLLALTKWGQMALANGAAAFYTRLTTSDIVTHPRRRAILDAVTAQPGIHLRELHRRAGGAWGPFTFHLGVLTRASLVRVAREGSYSVVLPAGPAREGGGPFIPNAVARAIYEALPADGSASPLPDVARAIGRSRELVAYHARSLEARELVARERLADGRMGLRRAVLAPKA